MQYRTLGKTGFKTSLLGMGCMRLPFVKDKNHEGVVDRPAAYELIRYAVDNGVNYFDTAFGYHGKESELILGEALEGRRKDVWITTKQPFWEMHTQPLIRQNLENTLKKLKTDYIDMYFIHRIMPASWDEMKERKIFAEYETFKREGMIKNIGFSYHGNFPHFKEVLAEYPWDMCMVQHNMLDISREVTEEGVTLAGTYGIGLAIMEPLRGGGLAQAPAPVNAVYESSNIKRTPAEWAFRYLADKPEISVIVSGMTTMEQLKENIAIFSNPDLVPGTLSKTEQTIINQARKEYESIITIPCTACNYCVPCPLGVQIPAIFGMYNDGHRFEKFDQPKRSYMFAKNAGGDVTKCTSCGKCIKKCPQDINIPSELNVAHKALAGWVE